MVKKGENIVSKIYMTSDTHFGHDREFLYGPRGFSSIQEHDEEVIRRWNSVVNPEDIVYHLGDVMLGDNEYGINCLSRLNGTIKIIRGNHDTDVRWKLYEALPNVVCVGWAEVIKYKKYHFYLSHHPTMTSNLDKAPYLRMHLINLFGHTHQQAQFYQNMPYMFHVGMDSNNCTPVLLDDAIELMKQETIKCLEFLGEDTPTIDPATQPTTDCHKCAYEVGCAAKNLTQHCPKFKRDPPDGGFYG